MGSEFDVKAIRVEKKEEEIAEEVDFFADMMPDFGGGGGKKKNDDGKADDKSPSKELLGKTSTTPSTTLIAPVASFGVMTSMATAAEGLGVDGEIEEEPTGWDDADDLGDNWDDF